MNINQSLIEELEGVAGQDFALSYFMASIRRGEGLSQVEFSKKLGVSKQFICDLERRRRSISPKVAEEFALKLGYSPKQFIKLCLQDMINRQGLEYKVVIEDVG